MATKATNIRVGNDRDGAEDGWFMRWDEADAIDLDESLDATTEAEAIAEAARLKGVDASEVAVMRG